MNNTEIGKMLPDSLFLENHFCNNCRKRIHKQECPLYKEEEFIFLKWFNNNDNIITD